MAKGDIVFVKGNGSSKRTAPGKDYVSGLIFYTGTLPSGFTTTNNAKRLYSLIDAENAGITNTYSDETQAQATYLVTSSGANGDTLNMKVIDAFGLVTDFGTYTKVSGDTTVTKVGDALALLINNGTNTHGYSAINTAGSVAIKATKGMGISLNSGTPVTVTLSAGATIAGTLTQFTGGVASKLAVYHYHISEYFRGNPNSELYVGFYPVPSTYTFSEITLLQTFANGELRQVGIYKDATFASSDLTVIDTEIKTYNDAHHKPLSALYAGNIKATTDITQIADLSVLSANKCSSIIGQDGGALGYRLYVTCGKSITQLGIALGLLSRSAVSEDFGQPSKFNISNGVENNVPAFANGQLLSDPSLSVSAIDAIDAKRQIFGQMYVGYAGTYFNDNHTAITTTSDYAYINDNRVIDKAIRGIYTSLIPYLKGKLFKNADGTLAQSTIEFYKTLALNPLEQMERDGDLSVVSPEDVYIDPTQDVTATNTLYINVVLNSVGIARNIVVPISFK